MSKSLSPLKHVLSRRSMLQRGAVATAIAVAGVPRLADAVPEAHAEAGALAPRTAIPALLAALQRYPLVGLSELHFLQEWHDLLHALLLHPDLPSGLTDIVVEFGNAQYQDLADRFILSDQPVAKADLALIWRFLGWDAPVYEEFFRTLRAVNWMRPANRRIRVLLGAQPIDVLKVKSAADTAFRSWWLNPVDAHFADLVEHGVLARGRRALLLAGGGHLLRGISADRGVPNVASRLAQRHPGALFVIDALAVHPDKPSVTGFDDATAQRLQTTFAAWPRPAIASLAGTWLAGTQSWGDRALSAAQNRYGLQADAILYLGPGGTLTASQTWPEIFETGPYHDQLLRLNPIVSQIDNTHEDLIAESEAWAKAAPIWWDQFGG